MNQTFVQDTVELNSTAQNVESQFSINDMERVLVDLNSSVSKLVNIHRTHGAQFHYILIKSSEKPLTIHFSEYEPISRVVKNNEFGLVLKTENNKEKYTIWLPSIGFEIIINGHCRISSSQSTNFSYKWEFVPKFQLKAYNYRKKDAFLAIPYIVFEDPNGSIFQEFNETKDFEKRLYRKSDWFFSKSPSDLWNYLINGSLYDPRCDETINKRFKCQQCALAWWDYFGYLFRQTGKTLYTIIQDEIAFSVLMDISSEGSWGHGYWSNNIESHTRFHLDGIHLFLNQYEKTTNPVWSDAAELGMKYVFKNLTDRFYNNSIWFLHDTIENEAKHRFNSTLFGKSPDNSLTINTHVQALIILYRLVESIPNNKVYFSMLEKGCQALQQALNHRPAEIVYRLMSFWILKYKTRKKSYSTAEKILGGIENRLLHKIYWQVQRLFPRLVHPNGFIERDLTLSFTSDRYHLINLKDLLLLFRSTGFSWLRPNIENSFDYLMKFIGNLGLDNAIDKSPFFIEFIDILNLYNNCVKSLNLKQIEQSEEIILNHTGGYSLDHYASDLVRKKSS